MFYIHDFLNDQYIMCEDEHAVIKTWQEKVSHERTAYGLKPIERKQRFEQLNVTGKDTYIVINFKTRYVGENLSCNCNRLKYLRQYQVLDDNGRSIDIAQWPEELWHETTPFDRSRYSRFSTGAKKHYHRIKGPAFHKATCQEYATTDDDEIYELTVKIKKPRIKTIISSYDEESYWERKAGNKWNQKSWKKSTKAPHQWAKHKTNVSPHFRKHIEQQEMNIEQDEPYNPLDDIDLPEDDF